jgi:predicted O-methyltransferase YrrM
LEDRLVIARVWRWVCHPRRSVSRARFRLFLRIYGLPGISLSAIAPEDPVVDPPILDNMCLPPYYGWSKHDDYTPLLKMVKTVQPRVLVELGTAHGNTVANICNQLPNCRVWTVNAPAERMTGEITTYSLDAGEIGSVYRRYGFGDRVVQTFENTLHLDLSKYFDEPCVDLAIIDACHDTEYVLNDFAKVAPFMRPGGLVLCHDTDPTPDAHTWGSYRACMRLRRQGFDIRLVDGTWWGVWRKDAPLVAPAPVPRSTTEPAPALPHA